MLMKIRAMERQIEVKVRRTPPPRAGGILERDGQTPGALGV
jgi:hypothetical protein